MAHPDQQKYCKKIKERVPSFFKNVKVLDIGSLDVNGNNRYLFENCNYIGLDVAEGKNVDIVCVAHKYDAENESFDTIISTNALEHDMYYELTLKKMVSLLKPGGFLVFSVANSFGEHGTKRKSPTDSNTSRMNETWANYYKNLTPEDIRKSLNLDEIFSEYSLEIFNKDLRFWGIKRKLNISLLEDKYNIFCKKVSDINEHLPTLYKYGKMVKHITEFGVRRGISTIAWLYSNPEELISYDISDRKFDHKLFKSLTPVSTNFVYILGNTLEIIIKETDLLFIDTYHTYTQLSNELRLHGNKSRKYLIFHDTKIFELVGEDKKEPALQKAIDEFITSNKHWVLKEKFENNNGLIILERKQ